MIDGTRRELLGWHGRWYCRSAPLTANAPKAQEKVDEMTAKIMSGESKRSKAHQGSVREYQVPEGTELTDEEMLSIDCSLSVVGTISSD